MQGGGSNNVSGNVRLSEKDEGEQIHEEGDAGRVN